MYQQAVRCRPDDPVGRINLGNALLAEHELDAARAQFDAALRLAPRHPDAHQGMANLLHERGHTETARVHLRASYAGRRPIEPTPQTGRGARVRVLSLVSAAGGNVPTRFLLDEESFATTTLVVEAFTADDTLPPHELVFNAIGDADLDHAVLDAAEAVVARTSAPVVNPPARVRRTGRAENALRFATLPGVVTPRTRTSRRAEIAAAAHEVGYPLLVRSLGHHTGRFFVRVAAAADLAEAVEGLPGDPLLVMSFLRAADAAGWARKYRVMIVGGVSYPLHLAISRDWKVHYFSAAMADRVDHREEERAFLADMPGVLGPAATQALQAVGATLGLDYAGVDFALGPSRELLLFEANATMVVNPPDPDPMWDYRRAPTLAVLDAVRELLLERSQSRP